MTKVSPVHAIFLHQIFDLSKFFVERDFFQKMITLVSMIKSAAKGIVTICQNKNPGINRQVIPGSLVKDFLCYFYVRSFAFNQKQRLHTGIMDKNIVSSLQPVHNHPFLYSGKGFRIMLIKDQKVQNMLSDPFFRT